MRLPRAATERIIPDGDGTERQSTIISLKYVIRALIKCPLFDLGEVGWQRDLAQRCVRVCVGSAGVPSRVRARLCLSSTAFL